jgi:hypothetical protein
MRVEVRGSRLRCGEFLPLTLTLSPQAARGNVRRSGTFIGKLTHKRHSRHGQKACRVAALHGG